MKLYCCNFSWINSSFQSSTSVWTLLLWHQPEHLTLQHISAFALLLRPLRTQNLRPKCSDFSISTSSSASSPAFQWGIASHLTIISGLLVISLLVPSPLPTHTHTRMHARTHTHYPSPYTVNPLNAGLTLVPWCKPFSISPHAPRYDLVSHSPNIFCSPPCLKSPMLIHIPGPDASLARIIYSSPSAFLSQCNHHFLWEGFPRPPQCEVGVPPCVWSNPADEWIIVVVV